MQRETYLEGSHKEKFRILKVCWMMYVLFPFRLNGISLLQNGIYYGLSLVFIGILFFRLVVKRVDGLYMRYIFEYLMILGVVTILAYFVQLLKIRMMIVI